MLEQKIDFVNENKGVLAFGSVLRNTVENGVENDQHTDRHKLFTEVENIIADQAIVRIHIRMLGKGV